MYRAPSVKEFRDFPALSHIKNPRKLMSRSKVELASYLQILFLTKAIKFLGKSIS